MNSIIENLQKDCNFHGYGRKKWWANQLGIPPLTLSHWLAGRQKPNARHSMFIHEIFQQNEKEKELQIFKEYFWDCYYQGKPVPPKIFPAILLQILSSSLLDSRTLALLSRLVEKNQPTFEIPESGKIKNRLGWLLEISGQPTPFPVDRSINTQTLLHLSTKIPHFKKYSQQYQTQVGKKWRVYDVPLNTLKQSLP